MVQFRESVCHECAAAVSIVNSPEKPSRPTAHYAASARSRARDPEPEGNMIYYNLASAKWCAVRPVGGLPRGKTFEADQSDDRYPLAVTSGVPERELE